MSLRESIPTFPLVCTCTCSTRSDFIDVRRLCEYPLCVSFISFEYRVVDRWRRLSRSLSALSSSAAVTAAHRPSLHLLFSLLILLFLSSPPNRTLTRAASSRGEGGVNGKVLAQGGAATIKRTAGGLIWTPSLPGKLSLVVVSITDQHLGRAISRPVMHGGPHRRSAGPSALCRMALRRDGELFFSGEHSGLRSSSCSRGLQNT